MGLKGYYKKSLTLGNLTMTIKTKAHYNAAMELLEIMSIASVLAVYIDLMWLLYEISVGGPTYGLIAIGIGLLSASVVMTIAAYRYHMKNVKIYLHNYYVLYQEKRALLNAHKVKQKRRVVTWKQ